MTPIEIENAARQDVVHKRWLAARQRMDEAVGREAIKLAKVEEAKARCDFQMEVLKK